MRERADIESDLGQGGMHVTRQERIAIELLADIRDLLQAGEDRIARLEKMAEERRRELQ